MNPATGHLGDRILQLGRVVSSSIFGASEVLFQVATGIGFRGEEEVIDDVPGFSGFGIVGRPPKREIIDGREYVCEVVLQRTGAGGVRPIAFRDLRWNRLMPNGPKEGELAVVGYAGQLVKFGIDGSITTFTTDDGTKDGHLIHAQVRRDGFSWVGPWGSVKLDETGFHAQHHTGARIDLGGIGGLPDPLDSLNFGSYARLSAAMIQLEASALSFGSSTGVGEPATKATTLQAYLSGLEAILVALATAIDAKLPTSAGVTVAATEGAIAALQAGKAAFASTSTGVT